MYTTLRRWWPLALFALVAVANTDMAVVNQEWFREHLRLTQTGLAGLLVTVSMMELVYEYWFFGWFGSVALRTAPALWPRILAALKEQARVRDKARKLEGILTADHTFDRIRDIAEVLAEGMDWRSHPKVKKGGYTALVVLSIPPLPGGRTVAVMLQRAARLPGGLVLIGVLSSVRTVYMLLGLDLATKFVSMQTMLIVSVPVVVAWFWRKVLQKGQSREDRT